MGYLWRGNKFSNPTPECMVNIKITFEEADGIVTN